MGYLPESSTGICWSQKGTNTNIGTGSSSNDKYLYNNHFVDQTETTLFRKIPPISFNLVLDEYCKAAEKKGSNFSDYRCEKCLGIENQTNYLSGIIN